MQDITQRVRNMRQNQTKAEKVLWSFLRASQIGTKWVRQKPILFNYQGKKRAFIADFYCKKARLIIEVDGNIHQNQIKYDKIRTEFLSNMDYKIIRFTNKEVIEDTKSVINSIISFLRERREDGT